MAPLHIEKLANAFITDARPSNALSSAMKNTLQRGLKKHGGLWVGGKVVINSTGLSFMPNGMNMVLHENLKAIYIPLDSIRNTKLSFGWLTSIVIVEHNQGIFRFRCFGAKRVVESLALHVAKD